MPGEFNIILTFAGRYLPKLANTPITQPIPVIVQGKNLWVMDEYSEVWAGLAGSIGNMNIGLMVPLGQDSNPGGIGTGTVLVWRAGSLWFVGTGAVYRNLLNVATASAALQFILNNILYQAGLLAPAAPVLRLTNESSKKPHGNYSLKLAQVRPETTEESNASPATNSVTANGQRLLIDMNGIATPSDGKRWAVYGSDGGASLLGPWFFRLEFNSSDLGNVVDSTNVIRQNSIAIEYYDLETSNILAPFEFAPPPPGTHLTTLGAVMCPLGTYGGAGISPSLQGTLGWPASFTRFLNPAEPIIRVDGRPGNGWQAVFTKNSLQALLLSGDDTGPVFVRSWWPTTGISNQSGACLIESEVYAVSGDGYLVRSNGSEVPDTSFAEDVRPDVKNIDPALAVVGYYPAMDAVIWCDGVQGIANVFRRGKDWTTPFDLPAIAQSACTVGGRLYVKFADGTVRRFDAGNGAGIAGSARSPWITIDGPRSRKVVTGWETVAKDSLTTKLFANKSTSTVMESQTDATPGEKHCPQVKTNVKKMKSFAIEHSAMPAGGRIYSTAVDGVVDPSRVDL